MTAAADTPPAIAAADRRAAILDAITPHAAFDGWSDKALRSALRDLGLSWEAGRIAFPEGVAGLVAMWWKRCDERMEAALASADFESLRTPERIAAAVRARLLAEQDDREAARRAHAFLAAPWRAGLAARLTWATVDRIWRACGDRAVDVSFYTKRATLAAVWGAAALCWLDDSSEDYAETWAFLDRRLGDVMRLHRLRAEATSGLGGLGAPLAAAGRAVASLVPRPR